MEGQVKVVYEQYYSTNSRSTRCVQLKKYFMFIDQFRGLLAPNPCPASQVVASVVWLSRSLKYSSITNYVSALNSFLKAGGCEPIDFSHIIKTVMGDTKRMLECGVRRAAPLLTGSADAGARTYVRPTRTRVYQGSHINWVSSQKMSTDRF